MLRVDEPAEAILLGLLITNDLIRGHGAPAVRVGMHHGSALEREGDYFGGTVNLAARVSGIASGGEVLLTGRTAALAPSTGGVFYESRGRHELRNVMEPVELFAAVREGEDADHLVIDPVCQMAVNSQRAAGRLEFEEEEAYFFCSLTCAGTFARHPERFAQDASQDVRSGEGHEQGRRPLSD